MLHIKDGDPVTWNNATGQERLPWPADANFQPLPDDQVSLANENYLCNKIPAKSPSTLSYSVLLPSTAPNILNYCCRLHPGEHGRIGPSTP